jgi:hypothetical protein
MPIKNILLSSGSAKRWSAPGNRFTYDTDTEYISIDNLSSSQFVLNGAISSVLINSGGIVTAYAANTNSGSYLVTDNTKWTVGSAGNVSIGPVSGTLSGRYPNPRFVDITYVDTGSLPVARGGFSGSGNFNLLSSIPSGSLIVANGTGSLTVVSTASYAEGNDYVLASVSGSSVWAAVTASAPVRDANVQFFTCSAPLTNTTASWVKQNPNHQWARVMLQAGGGAGAFGAGAVGAGGGAGGFTDITVYLGSTSTGVVTIGRGGKAIASGAANRIPAGSSSFSASNIFVSAREGENGVSPGNPGGAGGAGLTYNGGTGGTAPGGAGGSSAGSGGGAGSYTGTGFILGGTGGMYYSEITASTSPVDGRSFSGIFGYNIPLGFGSGGSYRGAAPITAGNGISGSGGSGMSGGSGNGGDGWVVVVSY